MRAAWLHGAYRERLFLSVSDFKLLTPVCSPFSTAQMMAVERPDVSAEADVRVVEQEKGASSLVTGPEPTVRDGNVVLFSAEDPEHPYNWSASRKWAITSLIFLISLIE